MSRSDEFERLYSTYYRRVQSLFRAYGIADEIARDLTQDVFLRVYERMDQFRGEAKWTYLSTIARRSYIDYLRRQQASKRAGATILLDDPLESAAELSDARISDPVDVMFNRTLVEQLRAAIEELPSGQRTVLRQYLEGLSYHEIAKQARISEDAVKSRLRDARRLLREKLAPDIPADDET